MKVKLGDLPEGRAFRTCLTEREGTVLRGQHNGNVNVLLGPSLRYPAWGHDQELTLAPGVIVEVLS